MQRTVWLFVGLLIGAGGMWAYATQVREPELASQVEMAVKEQFESAQQEKQMFVNATVTAVTGATITATTEQDDGEAVITIVVGPTTSLLVATNDDAATQKPIALSEITPGSVITVVTTDIIDLTQPINAASIIKL